MQQKVSMTGKYHTHTLQTNLQHHEEEPQKTISQKISGRFFRYYLDDAHTVLRFILYGCIDPKFSCACFVFLLRDASIICRDRKTLCLFILCDKYL